MPGPTSPMLAHLGSPKAGAGNKYQIRGGKRVHCLDPSSGPYEAPPVLGPPPRGSEKVTGRTDPFCLISYHILPYF